MQGLVNPIRKWIRFIQCISTLREITKTFQPDIVHAHYIYNYGFLGAISMVKNLIISVWGTDILIHPYENTLKRLLIKFSLKRALFICSTSNYLRDAVFSLSKRTSLVIPFGIDTNLFKPIDISIPTHQNFITIGTVKWLEEIYGIDILIRAYHLFKTMYPSLGTRLLIVGKGSQKAVLESLVNQFELTGQVTFIDNPKTQDIWKYHNMIDIFVNLSRSESFGVSVLESSACGKPIIASRIGGLKELIVEGVNGVLVESENIREAAEAIHSLTVDPVRRHKMGTAGRRRVLEKYEWESSLVQMTNLYYSVPKRP